MKIKFGVGLGLLLAALTVQAAEQSVQQLLQRMSKIAADAQQLEQALVSGRERAALCVHCHGEDGNSKREHIPNLASQNAEYLFTQFEHFADGVRKDYVMSKLAVGLAPQDRINVALYFSRQSVKEREQPIATDVKGEQIYKTMCFACHGASGHGNAQYPRIAGQPYEFLQRTLLHFLNNDEERKNSPMSSVIKNMNEQQLKDVAAYVTNMP